MLPIPQMAASESGGLGCATARSGSGSGFRPETRRDEIDLMRLERGRLDVDHCAWAWSCAVVWKIARFGMSSVGDDVKGRPPLRPSVEEK